MSKETVIPYKAHLKGSTTLSESLVPIVSPRIPFHENKVIVGSVGPSTFTDLDTINTKPDVENGYIDCIVRYLVLCRRAGTNGASPGVFSYEIILDIDQSPSIRLFHNYDPSLEYLTFTKETSGNNRILRVTNSHAGSTWDIILEASYLQFRAYVVPS